MKKSLFGKRWFSSQFFQGLNTLLHEGEKEALSLERALMSKLILDLLENQRKGTLHDPELYDFYAFCQQRLFKSHSQILQDLWVLFMLKEKRDGFFVEFGACDGKLLSNTLLLESEYGWSGILAEPNPIWHSRLKLNRKCNISEKCVYPESGNKVHFDSIPEMPELSRISDIVPSDVHERNGNRSKKESIQVETISLFDLLREYQAPQVVDYLSIDTEGSELEILKTFDFSEYKFRLISVEHAGEPDKRKGILELLEKNGYRRWRSELTRWDDWYVLVDT